MSKLKTVALLNILCIALVVSTIGIASACDPVLTVTPPEGFSSIMIEGRDFARNHRVYITYDGEPISTLPMTLWTNYKGNFNAMIVVPNQTDVGVHTINVTDSVGNSLVANFTVLDMTGPQGIQGVQGIAGIDGSNGIDGIDGQNIIVGVGQPNGTFGTLGDTYIDVSTGNVYSFYITEEEGLTTRGWTLIGSIKGASGADGIDGADGTDGITSTTTEGDNLLAIIALLVGGGAGVTAVYATKKKNKPETPS